MFWGSFHGNQKIIFPVWEKSWENLNPETYCQWILPRITTAREANPSNLLMQDGAPCHSARNTMEALLQAGVELIVWPPSSPDLNPVESVWKTMRDYIQARYPEFDNSKQISQQTLKQAIREASDSISSDKLGRLITGMPARFQDVKEAE